MVEALDESQLEGLREVAMRELARSEGVTRALHETHGLANRVADAARDPG